MTIMMMTKTTTKMTKDDDEDEDEGRRTSAPQKGQIQRLQSKNFLDDDDLEFEFLDLK